MLIDERSYLRDVLEPARTAGNVPPDDLRVRYALPDPLTAAEVAECVKGVRMCWRKARGQLRFRRLIDRLEGDHLKLAPLFERAAAGDLAPLRAELAGAAEKAGRRRSELLTRLLDAAGDSRMLAPSDLREIGGDAPAAREAGIEVREPDELPDGPPYAGYPRARDALDALGHRHLAEFLTGDPRAGKVIGLTLDLRPMIPAVGERWSRRPHDGNRTNADTVLVAIKQTGERLPELIRYDIVSRLRERHSQRASERALLGFAIEELGVDVGDARRLVFAVRREGGQPEGIAARLRDLIDSGDVHAAAELAAVAGPEGLSGDAEILADEARRRIAKATELRQDAATLALVDPDEAWLRLADAIRLVGDLPGAADLQAGLAPRPVPQLDAVVDGTRVSLAWPSTPSRVGEIGYAVVRCLGRVPRHPADGEALSGPVDEAPPINVPVYYAVFAIRGTAPSQACVAGPLHVRPEPGDVSLTAADGVVGGRWRCPAEAVRVQVTRDGLSVEADRTGMRDDDVRNGSSYHYRIASVYLDERGHEVITPGVHVAVTPTARPVAVHDFTVAPDPSGDLLVTFTEPPHGQVELVALNGPPPWTPGTTLSVDEVRRAGRVLRSTPAPGGVIVRSGPGVLLAVTVSGDVATVGVYREHVSLNPPRELIAERRGGQILLGFDWPPEVTDTEIRWRAGDGETRSLPVGRAGYEAHGGVRLPVSGGEPVTIEVAAAAVAYGRRVTGEPVVTVVPGRRSVAYDLHRPRLRGPLVITLDAPEPMVLPRLVLVTRSGPMPQRAGDGETVMSWEDVEVPGELELPMPRPAKPYWLRCFTEDDTIELRDPPVRRLKVG